MRGNSVSVKADLGKKNKQVNLSRIVSENSRSYKKLSKVIKISECQNTGLPSKTGVCSGF